MSGSALSEKLKTKSEKCNSSNVALYTLDLTLKQLLRKHLTWF